MEQANEEVALAFFRRTLASLPDPRRRQGIRYPLTSVVVIGLMAMVCGADNAEEMEDWGQANEEWLRKLMALPHGTPTQDVFLAVFWRNRSRGFPHRIRGVDATAPGAPQSCGQAHCRRRQDQPAQRG
jgi:hypothetical protein